MSQPGPPPPQPSFAQVPLPPGLTLDQYLTLQGQVVTIAITVAVAFAVILWDYLSLLPDEIELYRSSSKNVWQTPGTWFFIILRYAGILATLPSLFFTSVQSDHCQVAVVVSQVGAVLAVAASGAIFCFRVFVMWSGNNIVRGIVTFMYCGMLACWITVATRYSAIQGPATPFGSNCQMQPIVSWAPISYASSVAFDTVILLLTLGKIHTNLMMVKSQVGRQIYSDNVMYFLFTTITNIVVLSIQSLGSSHDMIKPTAVPFSTIMTVTMGSRVYLNLKLLDRRKERERDGIPLTSPMNSQGSASRGRDSSFFAASQVSYTTAQHTEKSAPASPFGYTAWQAPKSAVTERFTTITEVMDISRTRASEDYSNGHAR